MHPFELRPQFAQRVQHEIGKYISRAEIDAAVASFAQMVRPDRIHITAELANNPLSVVFTILDRLAVCRRLRQNSPYPPLVRPYLDDPLVSYLYLTCFDRLGQPANWLDFGAWLESSDCEDERDTILQEASQAASLNESIKIAYRRYKALYGLRPSFFRFLREILPPDVRGELLNSINRSITTNAPKLKGRQATDKEKYLFDRRNVFTHKAGFTPPPGEWFGGGVTNYVQEFHATYWTSTNTVGWPDILEKAVHVGLACYLRSSTKPRPESA